MLSGVRLQIKEFSPALRFWIKRQPPILGDERVVVSFALDAGMKFQPDSQ
jgi:hypothetical protein